jgi:NodT family efflux transporter outer membrane factor (OMF) lipoprotein
MITSRKLGLMGSLASVGLLGAWLGGCSVGPDYHRPTVPVPPQYKELPSWTAAAPADTKPRGDWWTDFHDTLLDQLEPQVAVSNQTVRQSYANYQQALAEAQVARSQLLPGIGVTGSLTRSGGAGNTSALATRRNTTHVVSAATLEVSASWTADIWGKVRRTVEQNVATAQSDEATLANATLSEQTFLATTVIQLRYADADIDLQKRSVQAFADALRIVKAQGEVGIAAAPPSAVIAAQVALETAQATLIGLGVARAQYVHAIAVLVGKNPEELNIAVSTAMPTLPDVPIGVPSTLLERRPDIAAAERTMAAQNAGIGVAIAAYYPRSRSWRRMDSRNHRWRVCCIRLTTSGRPASLALRRYSTSVRVMVKLRRPRRPTTRRWPGTAPPS